MSFSEARSFVFTADVRWILLALPALAAGLSISAKGSRQRLAGAALLIAGGAGLLLFAVLGLGLGLPETSYLVRGGIGAAHLAIWVAGINFVGVLVFDLLLRKIRVELPLLLRDIILAGSYAGAALTVASELGANITGLLATSAIVTAVVGLSLQDTLGNLMGGIVLQFENSLSVGDWVRVGADEGQVRDIRWRQTTLVTAAGNAVVIPNSLLTKSVVTVFGTIYGGELLRAREVPFPVYYDQSPDQVSQAVEKALSEDPPASVAASPAAVCVVLDYQPSHVVYAVRYFLRDLSAPGAADSEVRRRVYYALSRQGIKISVPQRSLVVHESGEQVRDAGRSRETARRVAALKGADIFSPLTDEERSVLAERLVAAPFAKGECLTRQGAQAHWLYVLLEGDAEVHVGSGQGSLRRSVARLGAGQIMGEMGLLTGEPRSATVVAMTEVLCYRLDRESFTDILRRRPEIAAGISKTLARRRAELEAAKGQLSAEVLLQHEELDSRDLLARIRGMFRLS